MKPNFKKNQVKKSKKNKQSQPWVNLQNLQHKSWDQNNTIESKSLKITKLSFQPTKYWKVKSKIKLIRKNNLEKRPWSTRINQLNLWHKSWD
jgi:NADPH-dependent 7-cyano-7-deazaguanine reductase QueF-like protein